MEMQDPVPGMTNRSSLQAERPEDARWYCDTCGWIEPKPTRVGNQTRYYRLQCACQKAAAEAARQVEQDAIWRSHAAKAAYEWLTNGSSPYPALSRADASRSPLVRKTFENFERSRQPVAFDLARQFAKAPTGTLVLHGTFGTGKTHLLAAVCNEARECHHTGGLFTTAPQLFAAIQERIGGHESYASLIRRASTTSLLLLDDIDKAKWTEFREEIYFSILDERAQNNLPTAISTNRLADLASFVGGACASRLSIGQIEVEMSGDDYRRQM